VPSSVAEHFLEDYDGSALSWKRPPGAPVAFETDRILFGNGDSAIEVAIASAARPGQPKADDLRSLFKKRQGGRPAPVILVVIYTATNGDPLAAVVGTTGDPAPITGLQPDRLARVCAEVLAKPDRHAAVRDFDRLITGLKDQQSPGLFNSGLFASHELRTGVPARADWEAARTAALPLLALSGQELIHALGYETATSGSAAIVLTEKGHARAVAVLLTEAEVFDRPSARFGAVTPVAYGLSTATKAEIDWLIVLRGTQIRLYPASPDVGVGRKGQGETYAELDLALLSGAEAGYLTLLFSPQALARGGSVEQILASSENFAADLGKRLRTRVYEDVVPTLAVAVARQMGARTEDDLGEAYHRTLLVLFRLLFLAYAEDRGLLPYGRNPRYDRHAVKTLAREFAAAPAMTFDPNATSMWDDMLTVWKAIDEGNTSWDVPPYNGGLFSRDPETSPAGAALATMHLADPDFGPALRAMLIDSGDDGSHGPVDFRSLGVREFGTIYEGLLESELSIAQADLTVDRRTKAYLPAKPHDEVVVLAGQIYIHNKSGERKSTGSYFTKQFAVEYLLDSALEPALTDHLASVAEFLATGDEAAAAEAFFDFRVADLAMGSAHFLVAAIDRIEARFTAFLAEHPVPAVADELARLERAAREALGDQAASIDIETGALLRRQIARRCIYGLDLNLIAVELARVSIWIHTFVPGLPMSTLDHNLVVGNSLTGIATVDEVLDVLDPNRPPGQDSLFGQEIRQALQNARDRLIRAAQTAEATKAEVRDAAKAHAQAMEDAADAKALMDAAVAIRLGLIPLSAEPDQVVRSVKGASTQDENVTVQEQVSRLQAGHLPYLFPEVFLRDKPGFDVMLGNPPWEKVMWQPAPYWAGVLPGLMAMPDRLREARIAQLRLEHPIEAQLERQEEQQRKVLQDLFKKVYTLRGGTHLELAQLMLERVLAIRRSSGRVGLVLPRQSMVLAGWKNLRAALTRDFDLRIVQGRNQGEWIFEDVHASYAVVFLSAAPAPDPVTRIWAAAKPDDVKNASDGNAIVLTRDNLDSFSEMHVIPWFTSMAERSVFDAMRGHPRLASGSGWIKATHDARWDFRGSGPDRALADRVERPSSWKILMTAHVDQFEFDFDEDFKQFISDFSALIAKRRGVALRHGTPVLTGAHPMIIVRHPSRSDDSRTIIATALPESGILHNKGYVHAAMHAENSTGDERLALLGLLNTLPADWWARRFVDRHVTAPVLNQIPLPTWDTAQIGEVARIAGTLLARHGYTVLAGQISVADAEAGTEIQLRARLERLALHGYGLDQQALELIAADFNETGFPLELRKELGVGHVPPRTQR
jgi:hypothetical protein